MSAQIIILTICLFSLAYCQPMFYTLSNWTRAEHKLPDTSKITGYNQAKDELLIFGGNSPNETFLVSYHLNSDQMYELQLQSPITMSDAADFGKQSFTRYENTIYFVDDYMLRVFHMNDTRSYASYLSNRTLPIFGERACVRISQDGNFIFIVGGGTPADDGTITEREQFTIYDISHDLWIDGPNMTQVRRDLACNVMSDYLYAIGGDVGTRRSDTIERIYVGNMDNITSETWHLISATLREPKKDVFCAGIDDTLYIFGGGTDESSTADVERLDTKTMSMYSDRSLPRAITRGFAEVIDGKIYIVRQRSIYWASLRTPGPTIDPTIGPTVSYTTSYAYRDHEEAVKTPVILYIIVPIPVIAAIIALIYCLLRKMKKNRNAVIKQVEGLRVDENNDEGPMTIEGSGHLNVCHNVVSCADNIAEDEFVVKGDDEIVTTK